MSDWATSPRVALGLAGVAAAVAVGHLLCGDPAIGAGYGFASAFGLMTAHTLWVMRRTRT